MMDLPRMWIGASDWLLPAAVMLVVLVATVVLAARWSHFRGRPALLSLGLKSIAVLLLCVALIDPLWSSSVPRRGANAVAILVDNSSSMDAVRDSRSGRSLGQTFAEVVLTASDWQQSLADQFQVESYRFGDRLQRIDADSTLEFDDSGTAMQIALEQLVSRPRVEPLAGIVLFSDGQGADPQWLEQLPADQLPPIYTVVTEIAEQSDLSILKAEPALSAFEDCPVNLRLQLSARGLKTDAVQITVTSISGETLHEHRCELNGHDAVVTRHVQLPASVRGQPAVRVVVNPVDDIAEVTQRNNQMWVELPSGDRRYRVLYLGGRPNWEYKFLKRALSVDDQLGLTALIRIARREARFQFRGHADESTNPLFRGFAPEAVETVEQYDEPVMVRLDTVDDQELRSGFPKTARELFPFDAVILDDIEADFLSVAQQQLLERFVSERGGALLFLGGAESFANGNYRGSVLAELMPVHLPRRTHGQTSSYRAILTHDGWSEPWMRLDTERTAEQELRNAAPGFRVVNVVGSLRPGARAMLELVDEAGGEQPGIAIQQFGAGRTAIIAAGDLWRWRMHSAEGEAPERAWRQLMRWLVADVPAQLTLDHVTLPHRPGLQLLGINVRDEGFEPETAARVSVTVTTPDGDQLELPAIPALDRPGRFEVEVSGREPGVYQARATVRPSDDLGAPQHVELSWGHEPLADELRQTQIQTAALETLAARSGGAVIRLEDLEQLADRLQRTEVPIMENRTSSAWHNGFVLFAVLVCLVGEWTLRRKAGQL